MAVAASSFTGVDLSRIPAPTVVEVLDFETLLAQWVTTFQGYCTAAGFDYTAILESDPVYKLFEVGAYHEMMLLQRINDAAKAVMVAYAVGPDLDNLAALVDVERYILTPADALHGVTEVDEADTALRQRAVLAPQGYSVAGPEGAYVFFAISADPSIKDVSVDNPVPGTVRVAVLGNTGDGTPSTTALAAVATALNAAKVRPLTDTVNVQAALIVPFAVAATLTFLPGYDHALVTGNAQSAAQAYITDNTMLGRPVTVSGLIAALFVPGIENVALTSPTADITPNMQEAGYCTGITLTDGGTFAGGS